MAAYISCSSCYQYSHNCHSQWVFDLLHLLRHRASRIAHAIAKSPLSRIYSKSNTHSFFYIVI